MGKQIFLFMYWRSRMLAIYACDALADFAIEQSEWERPSAGESPTARHKYLLTTLVLSIISLPPSNLRRAVSIWNMQLSIHSATSCCFPATQSDWKIWTMACSAWLTKHHGGIRRLCPFSRWWFRGRRACLTGKSWLNLRGRRFWREIALWLIVFTRDHNKAIFVCRRLGYGAFNIHFVGFTIDFPASFSQNRFSKRLGRIRCLNWQLWWAVVNEGSISIVRRVSSTLVNFIFLFIAGCDKGKLGQFHCWGHSRVFRKFEIVKEICQLINDWVVSV